MASTSWPCAAGRSSISAAAPHRWCSRSRCWRSIPSIPSAGRLRGDPAARGDPAVEAHARALDLFERVRIPSPARRSTAYPHEMSGGMRQRAMIALAPRAWPRSCLPTSRRRRWMRPCRCKFFLLLRELQRELGLSRIFVTHDISVAVEVADRIAVMYAGRIVEIGTVRDVIRAPRHPIRSACCRRGPMAVALPASACLLFPVVRLISPICPRVAPLRRVARWCSIAAGPRHPMSCRSAVGHLVRCWRTADTATASPTMPQLSEQRI